MSGKLRPTADEINEAHQLAKEHASTAVEYAIKCGKLLLAKKAELEHGKFESWCETWCSFGHRTARVYMQAAKQKSEGLAFDSLRSLFPKPQKNGSQNGSALPFSNEISRENTSIPDDDAPISTVPTASSGNNATAHTTAARTGSTEPPRASSEIHSTPTGATGRDSPRSGNVPGNVETIGSESLPAVGGADEGDEPDDDEEARLEAIEREIAASVDKVMAADDKLAAAYAEIKRQAAEIAILKISRDGYMNGKAAVTEMLKAEQRKVARLERRLKDAA